MILGIYEPFIQSDSAVRCVRLCKGDEITIVGERNTKLGEYFQGTRLLCIRRNKRDKWWQFWKPRYKSSTFRYMGESEVETNVETVRFVGNDILPHYR